MVVWYAKSCYTVLVGGIGKYYYKLSPSRKKNLQNHRQMSLDLQVKKQQLPVKEFHQVSLFIAEAELRLPRAPTGPYQNPVNHAPKPPGAIFESQYIAYGTTYDAGVRHLWETHQRLGPGAAHKPESHHWIIPASKKPLISSNTFLQKAIFDYRAYSHLE